MRVARLGLLTVCVAILAAARCAPFKTSISNGTGAPVDIVVRFTDGQAPAHGQLPTDGILDLEEGHASIAEIEYRYGQMRCAIRSPMKSAIRLTRC